MSIHPQVTIGLPVFNGATYLADALDSLLSQTFEGFKIIISDNASTDSTAAICQHYAAQDSRIRYIRNEQNIGAAKNFNKVFHLSDSPYFKWATHDDLYTHSFLERCVSELDKSPDVILAYGQTRFIDEHSVPGKRVLKASSAIAAHDPIRRYKSILHDTVWCIEGLGLIRSDVLRQTSLIGTYYGSDRVLLSHLSLLGRFFQVPEVLILRRCHPAQSSSIDMSIQDQARWISGQVNGALTFPQWHLFTGYLQALVQAPLSPADQLRGVGVLARLVMRTDKLKRLIVPGPHNYLGIGTRRKLSSQPDSRL